MTNSYSGNPADSDIDAVRFWVSDRGPDTWQISNEEIAYVLTQYANSLLAAAAIANEFAMKWALACDKAVGDLRLAFSQRSKMYQALAKQLKQEGEQQGPQLFAGGTCASDRQPFSLYQFDIPGACGPAIPPCGVCGGPSDGGCGCGG
jgi:hypothetical protein